MVSIKFEIDDLVNVSLDKICNERGQKKEILIRTLITDHLDRNAHQSLTKKIKDADFQNLRGMIDEDLGC